MTSASRIPPTIQPASPAAIAEALRLVFCRFEPTQAAAHTELYESSIRDGTIPPEGLLEARRGERLVGAILYQIQLGRTALLWPPTIAPRESPDTAARLLKAACQAMPRQGVRFANVLLDEIQTADDHLLREQGFFPLADLLYLVSPEEEFPWALSASPLEFEPYRPDRHERFARVVEATYQESLDCPGADGLREIDDVLAGYRATGQFAAERWLLVRHEGEDVGCLLLADHPREENWELVYMGLVTSIRGRGWGKQIVRHAQWLTRQAGRARLVLAVDAANHPALEMYTATGFRAWDRRHVYAKTFSVSP